jgi:hypothetical protein
MKAITGIAVLIGIAFSVSSSAAFAQGAPGSTPSKPNKVAVPPPPPPPGGPDKYRSQPKPPGTGPGDFAFEQGQSQAKAYCYDYASDDKCKGWLAWCVGPHEGMACAAGLDGSVYVCVCNRY